MNNIKVIVTAVLAAVSSFLGILFVPVMLLVLFNVIDYATGLFAAKNRGQKISSYQGIHGIAKKVAMYLLIMVGWGIDMLLISTGEILGVTSPLKFAIACVVAVWLVLNEALSIIENMIDMGVPMPPFLKPLIENLKTKVEEKTESEEE